MSSTIEIRIRTLASLAAATVVGVVGTMVVVAAWRADAAPGDIDSTYVPTAGCRVTDTRAATQIGPRSTPLGADEVLAVEIHGENGECTGSLAIPNDAVGVALNVTAVGATDRSNLRVYKGDLASPPNLSNLNVFPGAPPTPNKVDVQLSPSGGINVYNFKGTVDVLIDIVGYYTPQSLVQLAGQAGAVGPQGPAGASGPRGFSAWDVIPSGTTVTGNFVFDSEISITNDDNTYARDVALPGVAPVSLTSTDVNFSLSSGGAAGDGNAACSGSISTPTAPPGQVCIYRQTSSNSLDLRGFPAPLGDRGFQVVWSADGFNSIGNDFTVYATWAYTAP